MLVTGEDGEYFCSATNKHGSQNSSAVTVKIRGELEGGEAFRAARRWVEVAGAVPTRPLSLDLFSQPWKQLVYYSSVSAINSE